MTDKAQGAAHRAIVTICNEKGLHARASARFVNVAGSFDAALKVSRDDITVNGTSIMGLLTLGAAKGCEVEIFATGREAEAALQAVLELIKRGFDED